MKNCLSPTRLAGEIAEIIRIRGPEHVIFDHKLLEAGQRAIEVIGRGGIQGGVVVARVKSALFYQSAMISVALLPSVHEAGHWQSMTLDGSYVSK